MRTRIVLVAVALALAGVGVLAPVASATDASCTMSMPPECKVGRVGVVVCTMSMPPECRTG